MTQPTSAPSTAYDIEYVNERGGEHLDLEPTLDDAKTAAQEDWNRRCDDWGIPQEELEWSPGTDIGVELQGTATDGHCMYYLSPRTLPA